MKKLNSKIKKQNRLSQINKKTQKIRSNIFNSKMIKLKFQKKKLIMLIKMI